MPHPLSRGRTPSGRRLAGARCLALGALVLAPALRTLQGSEGQGPAGVAELPWVSPGEMGRSVRRWTVDDGLPVQTITALAQTTDGYLWCGTFEGLVRFDGVHFTTFYPEEVPALKGFRVVWLLADHAGRLWIVDEDGKLAVWGHGVFREITPAEGLPAGQAGKIAEGADGSIWLQGRTDGHFYRCRSQRFERVSLSSIKSTEIDRFQAGAGGLTWAVTLRSRSLLRFTPGGYEVQQILAPDGTPERIKRFFRLPDGTLAATANDGIYALDGSRWKLRHRFSRRIVGGAVLDGYEDTSGDFWIGTWNLGLIVSSRDGLTARVSLPGARRDSFIRDLLGDDQGDLWVAAEDGLYRLRRNTFRTWLNRGERESAVIQSVAKGSQERLWFITPHQAGWVADRRVHFAPMPAGSRILVSAAPALNGGIWVGELDHAAVWRWTAQQFKGIGEINSGKVLRPRDELINRLFQTKSGKLWAGTTAGLYSLKEGRFLKSALPAEAQGKGVSALAEDRQGRLYAGVYGVGLFRLNNEGWHRLTQAGEAGSASIRSLCCDRDGTLWICGEAPALARWKDDRWFAFKGLESQLPRVAYGLIADGHNGLWLTSGRGVVRLDRQQLNAWADHHVANVHGQWFYRADGLGSSQCNDVSSGICRDAQGRIWVATVAGLSMIDPALWAKEEAALRPLPVHIEAVQIDDQPVPLKPPDEPGRTNAGPGVTVPPGKRRVEIDYTAVGLSSPETIRFRYRLEGLDDQWSRPSKTRSVHFSHLPPGSYRFQVIAANRGEVWNRQGAALALIVLPAWYQTVWLRLLAAALVLSAGPLFYRRRMDRLERRRAQQEAFSRQLLEVQEAERGRLAAELHDSLGQNLLVIKNRALMALGRPGEPGKMTEQIEQVSQMASEALREVRAMAQDLRPFQLDEMGLTKAIAAMSRRLAESSGIRFHTDLAPLDGVFPKASEIHFYRIVQECLTNIVKHSQATEAGLIIRKTGPLLRVLVHDNGRGLPPAAPANDPARAGFGLHSMRERLRALGGQVRFDSRPGEGTTVVIELPIAGS
jgi:signal transduction histidine kinase/ligand-binding sensor domain-containing protein